MSVQGEINRISNAVADAYVELNDLGADMPDTQRVDFLAATVSSLRSAIFDKIYPVGAVYISENDTDPSVLFGGTWERIKDKFLLSAGDTYGAGDTGGEATHTLTVDEIPSHTHNFNSDLFWSGSAGGWASFKTGTSTSAGRGSLSLTSTGGGKPHNNMPPYRTVYMWKRTALAGWGTDAWGNQTGQSQIDFETAVNSIFDSREADYIVEQGKSGIWTYEKWNSGKAKCWGIVSGQIASASEIIQASYPFSFTAIENVQATGAWNDFSGSSYCAVIPTREQSRVVLRFHEYRGGSVSGTVGASVYAIGRWK